MINKPVNIPLSKIGKDCGLVEIQTRWLKIYDMLGIFFIPVRFNTAAEILVIPKTANCSEEVLTGKQAIIGYKKKAGGDFLMITKSENTVTATICVMFTGNYLPK